MNRKVKVIKQKFKFGSTDAIIILKEAITILKDKNQDIITHVHNIDTLLMFHKTKGNSSKLLS